MNTETASIIDPDALAKAVDLLAAGELIVVYFHGTYAFMCDADATAPADKLFRIKNRPREKGLSLVVDPQFLHEFVDLTHPAFEQFPLEKSVKLQRLLHGLGIIFPAGSNAPADLVQNNTILNVWTEYPPHRPFAQLTKLARAKGMRGFQGASTNLSNEDTYRTVEQVKAQFDGKIALILDGMVPMPEWRRKSTTLLDLTGIRPKIIRSGSVTPAEVQTALDQVGYGQLELATNIKVL